MSQGELNEEIERLCSKLYLLAESGAGYNELLYASQELEMSDI